MAWLDRETWLQHRRQKPMDPKALKSLQIERLKRKLKWDKERKIK